jgi:hypothetical protein
MSACHHMIQNLETGETTLYNNFFFIRISQTTKSSPNNPPDYSPLLIQIQFKAHIKHNTHTFHPGNTVHSWKVSLFIPGISYSLLGEVACYLALR